MQQLPLSLQLVVGGAVGASHGFGLPAAAGLCLQGWVPAQSDEGSEPQADSPGGPTPWVPKTEALLVFSFAVLMVSQIGHLDDHMEGAGAVIGKLTVTGGKALSLIF